MVEIERDSAMVGILTIFYQNSWGFTLTGALTFNIHFVPLMFMFLGLVFKNAEVKMAIYMLC